MKRFHAAAAGGCALALAVAAGFVACGGDDASPGADVDATAPNDVANDVVAVDGGGGDADAAASNGACRPSGWCWENPTPAGEHLTAVWGASPDDVWAVGWAGAMLHRTGGAWAHVVSPTTYNLGGVWGSSATDLWAVGDHGLVLHGDGASWTRASTPDAGSFPPSLRAVHGVSSSDVWAVGEFGSVLHLEGGVWTSRPPADAPASTWSSVFARASDDVWIAGQWSPANEPLEHWTGAGWASVQIAPADGGPAFAGTLRAVWVAPNGDVFATGLDQNLTTPWAFRRTGGVWLGSQLPVGTTPSALWGASATDVWIAGGKGTILHYDGASWTAASAVAGVTGSVDLEGVGGAGTDAWIVGAAATTLEHGAGTTWTSTPSLVTAVTRAPLSAVAALSADEAWAVGATELHRTSAGWAVANSLDDGGVLDDAGLAGVSAVAANDVWAGGASGVYHWNGSAWSARSALADGGTVASVGDISASGPNDVWAIGGAGVLHWAGSGWTDVPMTKADGGTLGSFFFRIVARAPNDVWLGGPFTLAHYDGVSWKNTGEGNATATFIGPVSGIVPLASNDVWMLTGVGSPTSAYRYDGATFTAYPVGGDWIDSLAFPSASASSPTDIWAVAGGGIAHYDGAAWSYSDRPAATLHGVAAKDGHAWAVGVDGNILHHAP